MLLASPGLDAIPHRMVSQLADRAIDTRLVTFHGYVHDQEMLLARQVRAADDTRTSSAGPPNRTRPESEGHRARSRGDLAGCTRIAGLQCPDVLHESRHHLPAADDHPARWRACPRVALRNDRRTRGNPDHVLSGEKEGGEEGGDGSCGCGGRAELEPVGFGKEGGWTGSRGNWVVAERHRRAAWRPVFPVTAQFALRRTKSDYRKTSHLDELSQSSRSRG